MRNSHPSLTEDKLFNMIGEDSIYQEIRQLQSNESPTMDIAPESFPLQARTISCLKREIERKRAGLQNQLCETYRRIKEESTPELILISGASGCGKTHLAQGLGDAVQGEGGVILRGKFDQLRPPEPYKAFVTAFTEFASSTTVDGLVRLPSIRQTIMEAVGEEGARVLIGMIPALEHILGTCQDNRMGITSQTQVGNISSFVFLIRILLKAIWSPDHPLLLILEDLQWADGCSLDLLTSLLTDHETDGVVFVVTCEDDVPSESEVSTFLRKLEDIDDVTITNISVGNLSKEEVFDILVSDHLPLGQPSVELIDLLFERTKGNVLYLVECIRLLTEENILESDQCSSSDILFKRKFTTARDLVSLKLERLRNDVKEIVKVASCLGSHVDEVMLRIVLDVNVSAALEASAENGFLTYDRRRQAYAFAHDVVKQAAYELIPVETRTAFHLMIGRKLWQQLDVKKVDSNIFSVVSQFLFSGDLIIDKTEKVGVATMCLRAGQMAAKASTFRIASIYLNFGIKLLGPTCWRVDYGLSLQLYNAAAEMALCVGDFGRMDDLLIAVFGNTRTFDDKLQAHATHIYSLGIRDQQQQAIVEGRQVLKELGMTFPRRFGKPRLLYEFAGIRARLRGKSDSMLLRMPTMDDARKVAAIQILDLMFLSAVIARPICVPMLVLKAMKVTLKYGLSPWAATSFAMYGMMSCTIGFVDEGFRFGQLSLKLLEISQRREFLPRVYAVVYGCIHCWKRPLQEALEPLRYAHRVGLETGDVEFSSLNANLFCWNSLQSGVPLPIVRSSIRGFCQLMATRRQESLLQLASVFLQALHHLMGLTTDPLSLSGDVIDYGVAFAHATQTDNATLKHAVLLERTILAYIFKALDVATELAEQLREGIFSLPPGADIFCACLFDGLVCIAAARDTKYKRKKYLRIADCYIRRFKKWGRDAPQNCLDMLCLLEAERASVSGQHKICLEKFTCANALAMASGCLWVQAITNERAWEHLVRIGETNSAQSFFCRACELWEQWGAVTKTQRLMATTSIPIMDVHAAALRQRNHEFGKSQCSTLTNLVQPGV